MSDFGNSLSLHDQIKLASEWGYNQEEILSALKANANDNSKSFERFENFDVMLDILNRNSGRDQINNNNSGSSSSKTSNKYGPGDMMSSSVTLLHPLPNSSQSSSNPRRSLSVNRSSSLHLATPKSTRDSHDIVRLLATLEKEKERDRQEVESQFKILKNRINHLETEKEALLQEVEEIRNSLETQDQELKENKEEVSRLMDEKLEAAEALDKLTIQNYRHKQEIHDQKELADHRKKIYKDEKERKDEEILNLQKKNIELETELERKSGLLDAQTGIAKRLEQQNNQLQPLLLLEDLTKKHGLMIELTSKILPNMDQIQLLYKQMFDTYPQMEESFRKEQQSYLQKVNDIEEKLNSKNRDFQRLQEKCVAECCICLNTKPSIVFLPCRHLISCADCYEKSDFRECPTCRSYIDNSITVFM